MPTYTINWAVVNSVLSQFDVINRQINTILSNLESETESSLREWTSDARQAYSQRKAQWDAAAARLPVTLRSAETSLRGMGDNMQNAERTGVDLF
ncbi:WXG100 family type VII secretion target [Amycolatopsis antarctica]|uniref:WXG100 family type VII secretion target n=1 Tax=Amycolatopsis antarctica TaxID=1854586 RepID=UPI0013FDB186|nr:WXG100 family type VII secretion target [Amycolatopsis antarctica]